MDLVKHSIRINTVTEPHVFPSRLTALDWLMTVVPFKNLPDEVQGKLLSGELAEYDPGDGHGSRLIKIVEMKNHGGEA